MSCIPVILGAQTWKDQKFKIIPGFLGISIQARATHLFKIKQTQKDKRKTNTPDKINKQKKKSSRNTRSHRESHKIKIS